MDFDELKLLIKNSVREKIKEEIKSLSRPPKTFGEFKRRLDNSLLKEGIFEEIDFEKSYLVWESLSQEVEDLKDWNPCFEYYLDHLGVSSDASCALLRNMTIRF
jgi:hypothetical protein